MATLEEMRDWLRGKKVEGLPDKTMVVRSKDYKVLIKDDLSEDNSTRPERALYKLASDGRDAVMLIGRHKGKYVTEIFKTDPSYLQWMKKQEWLVGIHELIDGVLSGSIKGHLESELVDILVDEKGDEYSLSGIMDEIAKDDVDREIIKSISKGSVSSANEKK